MVQVEDGEYQPDENTIISLVTIAVCAFLNEKTPAGEWDDETKQAVGVGIQQAVAIELTDIVEKVKSLEPLMVGIFQGPLIENIHSRAVEEGRSVGSIVAEVAFDAMNSGIKQLRGD